MVRKRGSRNAKLRNDVAHHHAVRVSREQEAHNTQARFRTECGEHIREPDHLFLCLFLAGRHSTSRSYHSTILELVKHCKRTVAALLVHKAKKASRSKRGKDRYDSKQEDAGWHDPAQAHLPRSPEYGNGPVL